MNIYRPYNCKFSDSDLMKFGLHGGREIRECQRCEQLVCEAHSVIVQDLYDRNILCSLCSKLVLN